MCDRVSGKKQLGIFGFQRERERERYLDSNPSQVLGDCVILGKLVNISESFKQLSCNIGMKKTT